MRILVGGDRDLRSGCALLQLGARPHKGLADGKGVLVGVSRGSKRWYWPPDKGAFRASHSRSGTASRFDHGSRQAERSHPLVFEAGPSVDVHPQASTRVTRFTVIVEGQDELYPSQRRLLCRRVDSRQRGRGVEISFRSGLRWFKEVLGLYSAFNGGNMYRRSEMIVYAKPVAMKGPVGWSLAIVAVRQKRPLFRPTGNL